MKFRSRATVEAIQWDETKTTLSLLESMGAQMARCEGHADRPNECTHLRIFDPTRNDPSIPVGRWDWVIRGKNGRISVLGANEFEEQYESREDADRGLAEAIDDLESVADMLACMDAPSYVVDARRFLLEAITAIGKLRSEP